MAKKKISGKTFPKTTINTKERGQLKPQERDLRWLWIKDIGLLPKELSILRYVILAVALILSVLSIRVGLNGDDDVQANYSTDLLSFYGTFGKDTTCFTSGPEIKYYGAFYELITGLSNKLLGFEKTEPRYYAVRHIGNAIFGSIAIYFLALLVGNVAGFHASLLSVILMFFTMRFLGHSLFNPKDIPFAAGYMVSLYYLYQTLKMLPQVSRSTLAGLSMGIMMSIGIRIGGLLIIGYLGLFLAAYFIWKHGVAAVFRPVAKPYYQAFFIPATLGLGGALLVWPFGLLNPFKNIPVALEAFSNFQYAIKVLFDGRQVWSSEIPFQYLFTWMSLTMPLFTLLGAVFFGMLIRSVFRYFNFIPIVLCLFAFSFPIIYVLVSGSILYDGWRHFLFTYPPLIFLVTLGWQTITQKFAARPMAKYLIYSFLGLSMIDSAFFLVRNSAYPYIYFNPLSGGMKGAYGDYELDYWGASVKQAVESMEDEGILSENMTDTITVASNFSHALQVYTKKYNGLVKVNYVRWRQRNDRPWDYGIFVNRFVDGEYLKNGFWPTSKTIKSIKSNGVPIAIIEQDGVNSDAYLAAQAVSRQDWDEVISYASKETEAHPDNELAWVNLGMAFLNKEQHLEAKIPLDRALAIVPDNQNALNFMGYYYFATNNLNEAYATFTKAFDRHQTNITALYYLGRIAFVRGDYSQALKYALQGIENTPSNPLCYQLASETYRAMGDVANSQRYLEAVNRLTGK